METTDTLRHDGAAAASAEHTTVHIADAPTIDPAPTAESGFDAADPISDAPPLPVSAPIPIVEPAPGVSGSEPGRDMPAMTALWERIRQFRPRPRVPEDSPSSSGTVQPAVGDESSGRNNRFRLLAASIALAAGVGAAVGAAGFAGTASLIGPSAPEHAPLPATLLQRGDVAAETKALKESIAQLRASIKTLTDNVAALKTGVDAAGKTHGAAIAKLNEQVGKLQEGIERTSAAAPEVTGSVPAPNPRPPALAPGPKPLGVVGGWTLRSVYGGVALVDGRYGEVEVMAGDTVRGLGKIQEIRRQDGRWVVVTDRGLIVPR